MSGNRIQNVSDISFARNSKNNEQILDKILGLKHDTFCGGINFRLKQ